MPEQPRQTPAKKPARRFSVAAVTHPTAGGGEHTAPATTEPEQDSPAPAPQIVEEATEAPPATPDVPEADSGAQEPDEVAPEPPEEDGTPEVPPVGTATSTTDVIVHRTSPAEQHLGALARRARGNISQAMHATFTRSLGTELMSLRSLADRLYKKQADFENLVAEARSMGYPLDDVNRLCVTHDWFEVADDSGQQT